MRPEESTVLIRHLRFKPEPEFHPHLLNLSGKPGNTSRQLVKIRVPVTQGSVILIALSKPSVVQDEELHANLLCFFGNPQNLFFVKIKIGRLPVIDEDRPCLVPPYASRKPGPVQIVERPAHLVHPPVRVDHHHLRGLEGFTLCHLPTKFIRVDSHHNPCHIEVVHLHLGEKITAVDQTASDRLSLVLIGI